MSFRRTGLWMLIGACALACDAEERDFGETDSGVRADSDDESATESDNDASTVGADAAATSDASAEPSEESESSEPGSSEETAVPTEDSDEESSEETEATEDSEPSETDATEAPTETSEPDPTTDETTSEPEPEDDAGVDGGGSSPACTTDAHCDDLNPCNGQEECAEGECKAAVWEENGAHCELGTDAAMRVCSEGNCVLSICGDGYTDERKDERCDDANAENADGCTVTCEYSCNEDSECDDSGICNGQETCDPELHMCVAGDWADEASECGNGVLCHAGQCVPEGCGNGAVEAETEACDDGNVDAGDGCEADCTFSCVEDAQCDDGSVCTGNETCDPELHICLPGEELACEAPDECTTAECDAISGCYYPLIDVDGDGQASSEYECGTDCDDADISRYAGAGELCDNKDNNCNGETDETAPTWYVDCDGDGYAPANAAGTQQCAAPEQPPAECEGRGLVGAWTATAPVSGNADCWDDSANVHPMNATENNSAWNINEIEGRPVSVDFDYNCDDVEEPYEDREYVSTSAQCGPPVLEPAFSTQASGSQVFINCIGYAGWQQTASPACGDSGVWTSCSNAGGSCQRLNNQTAYKRCR